MRGDLKIRKVQTASRATAVQVVENKGTGRSFLKHIGSTTTSMSLNCCWMRPNNTSKPIAASQTCSLILVLILRLHHHCSSWFLTNQASLASPISLPAMRCLPAPENVGWALCRNCILIWLSCASSSRHRSCARWSFLSCISRSPMRSEPSIAYFRSSWSIRRR